MDDIQGKELVVLCGAYSEWSYYRYKSYPDKLYCELRIGSGGTRSPNDWGRYVANEILEGGNRRKARKLRKELAEMQEWLDRHDAYEAKYCPDVTAGA